MLSQDRAFGARYVTALCALPTVGDGRTKPPVPVRAGAEFETVAAALPPMIGGEYLTAAVLGDLWRRINEPSWPKRESQCKRSSRAATPPGILSGISI
jgi:hypothetical protein